MYFKDLTPYTYAGSRGELNVGWLDISEPYNKAPIPAEFVFALQRFKKDDAITKRTKGFHMCPFCTSASSSSEIRAFSKDGSSYAAPYMIFHYVEAHGYAPPAEFMDAVINGPQPGSSEYEERMGHV